MPAFSKLGQYQSVFLSIFVSISVIGFLMCFIAVWNRKRFPPFAAKQLEPICLSLIAATFWCTGRIYGLGLFGYNGIFRYCHFWMFVWQCTFGVNLYLSLLIFRLQRLYYILVIKQERKGFLFWSPMIIPMILSLIVSLVPYIVGYQVEFVDSIESCDQIKPIVQTSGYLVVFLQTAIIVTLNVFLVYIKKAVNEVGWIFFYILV